MVPPSPRVTLALNVAAKLMLAGLLVFAMTHLEMERLAGKAMTGRALFYPISAIVIPIVWLLRGRPAPYPHAADALLVAPFLVDLWGNVLDLYNGIVWFDDVAHSVTWMLLVLAVGMLMLRWGLPHWVTAGLCIGFGAVTHIVWEIVEFVALWYGAPGMHLTYEDTIGDLAMSLCGTLIAGLVTGWRADRAARRA